MTPLRQKQNDAATRNTAWNAMSPEAQLKDLDNRPGASVKQRAKIQKRLNERVKA